MIDPKAVPEPYPPQSKPTVAVVSTTGTPVLKPKAVPWIATAFAVLGVVAQSLPPATIGYHILNVLLMVAGPVMGMISPGLRKQP